MLKILLIKRGAIGDLLLATPLIRQLKNQLGCQLDLLTAKSAAVAVAANPFLDQQFVLADHDFAMAGFWRLSGWLLAHRRHYDYVFILDKHWYFNLLGQLLGAKSVGYSREWLSRQLLSYSVEYDSVERYHASYYLDLLQITGLAPADYADQELDVTVGCEDQQLVSELLIRHNLSDFTIVVNSGGNNSYETSGIRMLPADKILELLSSLLNAGKMVILLGGSQDKVNYQSYLQRLNFPEGLLNLAGSLTLAQSAWLISRATKFYTTDCGAMHLGVAMRLAGRMTAFFGPTNPGHILPPKYLSSSAIWSDQLIYSPEYQLNGKLRNKEPSYFSRLNFTKNG